MVRDGFAHLLDVFTVGDMSDIFTTCACADCSVFPSLCTFCTTDVINK